MELLSIGPVKPSDIEDILKAIKDEGSNFMNAPSVDLSWPLYTMGHEAMRKQMDEIVDAMEECEEECTDGT
jgi:hypothetical protein